MFQSEKYSFLLSVYIKENPLYLEETLKSLVSQTVTPDEIIIIYDGDIGVEKDNIIREYIMNNPNIYFNIIELNENLGLGAALNLGLLNSKNELIARMDTDDICRHDRIEKQLKMFKDDPDLVICGSYVDEFDDDYKKKYCVRKVPTVHSAIKKFSRRRSPFNHPTIMYKKSYVLKLGGYLESRRCEDLFLFGIMLKNDYKSCNIPESLVFYRANEAQFMRRKSKENCIGFVKVINQLRKEGHSSFIDVFVVGVAQLIFYTSPISVARYLNEKILRR